MPRQNHFNGCGSTIHTMKLDSQLQMILDVVNNAPQLSWLVDPGLTKWAVIFVTTLSALRDAGPFSFFKDGNMHLEMDNYN